MKKMLRHILSIVFHDLEVPLAAIERVSKAKATELKGVL